MNLLLHWLRWDLRRFRWPLLAWTAMLTGFVCYLGWLHLNLLTIDPRILKYNEAGGAVLGIFEFFLLLRILSSDPAAGTRPFWKTRPPAGFAVAGAKATIAILFFLALPILLQWLMYQWCHLGAPGPRWSGKSWPWMLWWTQCFAIGTLLVASSAAGGSTVALTRLACGALPLLAVTALAVQMRPMPQIEHFAGRSFAAPLENAVLHAGNMGLWLVAGIACFLGMRRTRTPSGWMRIVPAWLPMVAILIGAALAPWSPRFVRSSPPPLPADLAARIKIGEPLLRGGSAARFTEAFDEKGRTVKVPGLEMNLHLDGIAPDGFAAAKWKILRLIHPEGRTLEVPIELLAAGYHTLPPDGHTLPVADARFLPGSLDPFSLTACRVEGILIVSMYRWVQKAVPVEPGQRIETPGSTLVIEELRDFAALAGGSGVIGDPYLGRDLMYLTGIRREEPLSGMNWWLQHRALPECRIALRPSGKITSGYFMEHARENWTMPPETRASPLAAVKILRAAKENRLSDWDLHASRLELLGAVDVPVALKEVFIPRQLSDTRKPEDIVSSFDVSRSSPQELKRTVKLALAMPQLAQQEGPDTPVLAAMSRFLDSVPREHLAVLMEVAKEDLPPGNMNMRYGFDTPLCRRIAELMDTDGVAELRRSDPRLLRYLRFELAKRNLIPYGEAHSADWEDMSDDAILRNWQASYNTESLRTSALEQAATRGLPWVPAAVADVVDLLPSTSEAKEVIGFMSKLSDCPADPATGLPWLQQNAAHLTWDASAKRWRMPVKP